MTSLDRDQLKRDCSDALEVLSREQRTDRIAELAESLRTLGPRIGSQLGPRDVKHETRVDAPEGFGDGKQLPLT